MKTVRDTLKEKGEEVYHVSPSQTVFSAAEFMTEKQIGAAIVMEGARLLGMLSERDIMTRIVSQGKNPHTVAVGEVMSMDLVFASPDESVEDCVMKMKGAKCRHLPVVEEGHLMGIISLRDLLGIEASEKEENVQRLDQYIWNLPSRMHEKQ